MAFGPTQSRGPVEGNKVTEGVLRDEPVAQMPAMRVQPGQNLRNFSSKFEIALIIMERK